MIMTLLKDFILLKVIKMEHLQQDMIKMKKLNLIWIIVLIFIVSAISVSANYTSQYPPAFTETYVIATTHYALESLIPPLTTNNASSLTGDWINNQWVSGNGVNSNQRFHIDLGSAKTIRRIYYENGHQNGGDTNTGAKNFTFWGSNTGASFLETTYATDTGWTEIPVAQYFLDEHVGTNNPDPKYILVTNSVAYKYYAFKFSNNYNYASFMGVRRIELQTEDLIINSSWNVTSQNLPAGENSSIWNAGGQYVINITNNTLSLTVTTDEASNGSCAIGKNWNYSTMVAYEPNYKFATTDVTEHAYLIYDDIPIGNSCLYCSFIDASGNEFANSSSGCLNLTRTIPITGYVFDDLTNVIEGAIVYITNLFTNVTEKVTTNVSGMYESSQGYEKGIHLISGYDPSNYSLQPDAQLVNVTE